MSKLRMKVDVTLVFVDEALDEIDNVSGETILEEMAKGNIYIENLEGVAIDEDGTEACIDVEILEIVNQLLGKTGA